MHENRNLFLFLIKINNMHRTRHILPIPRTCIWRRCGVCGIALKHDGTDGTPNLHCVNDKSILKTSIFAMPVTVSRHFKFEQCTLLVPVLALIIFGNYGHFAFWPIALFDNYMPLVPSPCGHLQSCYVSRLPVPSRSSRRSATALLAV